MRLLNTATFKLETFLGEGIPKYAILSHTWGDDEVLFQDLQRKGWKGKEGANKVTRSARIARRHGYKYIWIDNCCIDKSSSAELSEAINSMFQWYQNAMVCYAYLSDVPSPKEYLQELIAPRKIIFFGTGWKKIGTRRKMARKLNRITRVDMDVLSRRGGRYSTPPWSVLRYHSTHSKMLWAANRATTRPEDRAYSLMGIFQVNMPLLYGEGSVKAFRRLQEEILKSSNDQSILLFNDPLNSGACLAVSPDEFDLGPSMRFDPSPATRSLPLEKTLNGVKASLSLCMEISGSQLGLVECFLGVVECFFRDDSSKLDRPVILLRQYTNTYRRVRDVIHDPSQLDVGRLRYKGNGCILLDKFPTRVDCYRTHSLGRRVIEIEDIGAEPLNSRVFNKPTMIIDTALWPMGPQLRNGEPVFIGETRKSGHNTTHPRRWPYFGLFNSRGPREASQQRYTPYHFCPSADHRGVIHTGNVYQDVDWPFFHNLYACICLRDRCEQMPPLVLLIFQDEIRETKFLHLVDLERWLGHAHSTEFRPMKVREVVTLLPGIATLDIEWFRPLVRHQRHILLYSIVNGATIKTTRGKWVTARIHKVDLIYLEDPVYCLEIETSSIKDKIFFYATRGKGIRRRLMWPVERYLKYQAAKKAESDQKKRHIALSGTQHRL
ncbi:heterokaryon incompatibility protein-domain-containing protein [Xylariaceae sp. FL1272]|nr:heterokaryon incompatibility protein-domain-containing protein [Xylariaceae sp. FL1272]